MSNSETPENISQENNTTKKSEGNALSASATKQLVNLTEMIITNASKTDIPFIFLSICIASMAIFSMVVLHPEILAIFSQTKDVKDSIRTDGTSLMDIYFILWGTIMALLWAFVYNKSQAKEEIRAARESLNAKM